MSERQMPNRISTSHEFAARTGVVTMMVLVCLFLSSASVGAQTATVAGAYPFPVAVARCEQVPSGGQSFPPLGCTALAGVTVWAMTADNRSLGSCVTGSDGTCQLPVRYNSMVIVGESLKNVPPGYQPLANPGMQWVYTEFAGARFYNVRAAQIPASPEAGGAALTIHSRVCPAGYSGPNYFQTCHGTIPAYKQWFFALNGHRARAVQIGTDGNVVFRDLQPGEIQVRPGLPEATERVVLFCSQAATPGIEYPSTVRHSPYEPVNSYTALLTLHPDAAILCDLFTIPQGGA